MEMERMGEMVGMVVNDTVEDGGVVDKGMVDEGSDMY